MKITDKPKREGCYPHVLTRPPSGFKRLKRALMRHRCSINSLRGLYNTEQELYEAAQALDIKQTYLDGEWYWELYKPEHKGFSFKPLSDL